MAALYRKRMLALIDEMAASMEYWLTATYGKAPLVTAVDASG
jgi:hypothetical protein